MRYTLVNYITFSIVGGVLASAGVNYQAWQFWVVMFGMIVIGINGATMES
jgi:hypothetical protein